MCNSHVLECPFCTNNNQFLDCQDCIEKILEDGFGFKVHNLQDSDSSSSSTCLKEPDFVVTCVARNDEESSSRSDVQVSVIESPEIVPFGFGKEIMNEGEFSQLSCVISKGDEPLINQSKKSKVSKGPRIQIKVPI